MVRTYSCKCRSPRAGCRLITEERPCRDKWLNEKAVVATVVVMVVVRVVVVVLVVVVLAGAAGRTGEPGSMSKMSRSVESVSELSLWRFRRRAFSSRSALKSFSRGVSAAESGGGERGGEDDCEPSVLSASPSKARRPGDEPRTGTDLEKNLGTGSDEGAGEWWKPGPA